MRSRWSVPTNQSRGVTLKVHAPMLLSLYPYQQALQHFWKHLVQMLRLRSVRLRPAFRLGVTRIKNWPQPLGSLFRVCIGPREVGGFVKLEPFLSDLGSWGMGVSQMLKPTLPCRTEVWKCQWIDTLCFITGSSSLDFGSQRKASKPQITRVGDWKSF